MATQTTKDEDFAYEAITPSLKRVKDAFDEALKIANESYDLFFDQYREYEKALESKYGVCVDYDNDYIHIKYPSVELREKHEAQLKHLSGLIDQARKSIEELEKTVFEIEYMA